SVISYTPRPRAARCWLDGTADGRPLKTADVAIAQVGSAPLAVPVKLPEIESEGEERPKGNLFAPPASPAAAGLQLWLAQSTGHRSFEMGKETGGRMRALGYGGTCATP